jgi:hypothetical protein
VTESRQLPEDLALLELRSTLDVLASKRVERPLQVEEMRALERHVQRLAALYPTQFREALRVAQERYPRAGLGSLRPPRPAKRLSLQLEGRQRS